MILPDTTSIGMLSPSPGEQRHLLAPRRRGTSVKSEMKLVNFVSFERTADESCELSARPAGGGAEQQLRLAVHEDDVRPVVGDENRIGDVREDEIETVALALGSNSARRTR